MEKGTRNIVESGGRMNKVRMMLGSETLGRECLQVGSHKCKQAETCKICLFVFACKINLFMEQTGQLIGILFTK